jgi:hypothetical protein
MRAVAIVWSYGRASLNELIGMWQRQTIDVPLLVWLDGAAMESTAAPAGVLVHQAAELGPADCLAPMRRASIDFARRHFELTTTDAFLVLEDDDYYAPDHAQRALAVLQGGAMWTGSLHIGLQVHPGRIPELVKGESGPGQHAAWAMRLGLYDHAGGYPDTQQDDVALGFAAGWARCASHRHLTHVRRMHRTNLCRLEYDRAAARSRTPLTQNCQPRWNPELDMLEEWVRANA